MQRALLISVFFVVTSFVLPAIHAQGQTAPIGTAEQNQPVGIIGDNRQAQASTGVTADYPMDQAGVLIKGAGWRVIVNQYPTKTRAAHSIAASLSYGIVPVKIVAEYQGEHASTEVETTQPVICICHMLSLPGEPVLVRLHPKKGARELDGGRMIVYPVVGGSKMADANKTDLVVADVSHPDAHVWLIHPQSPLDPGEYALMLGTQNMSIFPFTIRALPVHSSGVN